MAISGLLPQKMAEGAMALEICGANLILWRPLRPADAPRMHPGEHA
jgi:hypothetical protein